ncbi:MAG: Crp/Fnr family transcriptional regulator [Pseudomonadota bacterium]
MKYIKMNISKFLSSNFFFSTLEDKELEKISSFSETKRVKNRKLLFQEGEKATAFFIVCTGKLKVFKVSSEGKEQTIHLQKQSDLIAEASIFDKEIYPASCQALEDSTLVRIPKIEFIKFLKDNPEISIKLLNAYSIRLRKMVMLVEDLSLSDVKKRLARYFIENMTKEKEEYICKSGISKKEISSYLGTTPESFSRAMNQLKKEDIIEEKDGVIYIKDSYKLSVV